MRVSIHRGPRIAAGNYRWKETLRPEAVECSRSSSDSGILAIAVRTEGKMVGQSTTVEDI